MALLTVENVTRRFGGILALTRLVRRRGGRIVGLIGPNGAGKTTAFNVITRVYTPDEGRSTSTATTCCGRRRTQVSAAASRARSRTSRCSAGMTVLENVLVGAHTRRRSGERGRGGGRAGHSATSISTACAHHPVGSLPYGTQKRVETARALVSRPRLLLLDEPAGGLNHEEVDALGRLIRRMRADFDLTILLVEHHMSLVMGISDRVHVLELRHA